MSKALEDFTLQVALQRKRARTALDVQATSAWRLHRQHLVWAAWSKNVAAKVLMRVAMQRVVLYWSNKALVRAFKPWQSRAKHSHDLDALLAICLGECAIHS